MTKFRDDSSQLLEKHGIEDLDKFYYADQTGLFYQKLPNCIYCNKEHRSTVRGVKQMKDKSRIALMVCKSASGEEAPLAVIGTAKLPNCFDLANGSPPLPFYQDNAWFGKNVNMVDK